ncbi:MULTISPECIES: hypothetical protein [Burkholderia]|uniref:Secreted protein n=1 Tax=Burkholderia mayonis TaxID=1385591 RepID=A0A1B4FIW0_9BURK|nr:MULTISPECIES: hypothetical protein [Burkholderia]AOJ03633.1 hypothetical protein WS70_14205 [Burkholderia mayonis]KVE44294.1 hypothetical protein WS70_07295 [Burkholderia mayonis]KVE45046.1 hypothetical protein WS69_18835 [Burkholderia sp. BDU5]
MIAGVVLWVALAVIFPTVAVPAAQHAVEHVVDHPGKRAAPPAAQHGSDAQGQPASPDGGDTIER